jgi:hypothetical protein
MSVELVNLIMEAEEAGESPSVFFRKAYEEDPKKAFEFLTSWNRPNDRMSERSKSILGSIYDSKVPLLSGWETLAGEAADLGIVSDLIKSVYEATKTKFPKQNLETLTFSDFAKMHGVESDGSKFEYKSAPEPESKVEEPEDEFEKNIAKISDFIKPKEVATEPDKEEPEEEPDKEPEEPEGATLELSDEEPEAIEEKPKKKPEEMIAVIMKSSVDKQEALLKDEKPAYMKRNKETGKPEKTSKKNWVWGLLSGWLSGREGIKSAGVMYKLPEFLKEKYGIDINDTPLNKIKKYVYNNVIKGLGEPVAESYLDRIDSLNEGIWDRIKSIGSRGKKAEPTKAPKDAVQSLIDFTNQQTAELPGWMGPAGKGGLKSWRGKAQSEIDRLKAQRERDIELYGEPVSPAEKKVTSVVQKGIEDIRKKRAKTQERLMRAQLRAAKAAATEKAKKEKKKKEEEEKQIKQSGETNYDMIIKYMKDNSLLNVLFNLPSDIGADKVANSLIDKLLTYSRPELGSGADEEVRAVAQNTLRRLSKSNKFANLPADEVGQEERFEELIDEAIAVYEEQQQQAW